MFLTDSPGIVHCQATRAQWGGRQRPYPAEWQILTKQHGSEVSIVDEHLNPQTMIYKASVHRDNPANDVSVFDLLSCFIWSRIFLLQYTVLFLAHPSRLRVQTTLCYPVDTRLGACNVWQCRLFASEEPKVWVTSQSRVLCLVLGFDAGYTSGAVWLMMVYALSNFLLRRTIGDLIHKSDFVADTTLSDSPV